MNSHCRSSMFNNTVLSSNCIPNNSNVLNTQDTCTDENLLDSICCCVGRRCICEFEIDGDLEKRERYIRKSWW